MLWSGFPGILVVAYLCGRGGKLPPLGLGASPETPEWGAMIGREGSNVFAAPHLLIFPGIALTLTVLAYNLFGDGLRDALDPRLHR